MWSLVALQIMIPRTELTEQKTLLRKGNRGYLPLTRRLGAARTKKILTSGDRTPAQTVGQLRCI